MKCISSVYIYSPSNSDVPTPASHPTPLGHPRALSWAPACYTEASHQLPILHRECVCMPCVQLLQLHPTLCDPMDYSPPGYSIHGILQARIPERVSMPPSRGSSWPRDRTHISCIFHIIGTFFTAEPLGRCTYITYVHISHISHMEVYIYHICTFPAFCSSSKTMIVLITKQWRSSNYTQISENEVRNSRAIPSSSYVLGESVHGASQFSRLEEQFSNVSISVTFTLYCYCSSVFGKWSPSWQKPCCIPVSPVAHRVPNS